MNSDLGYLYHLSFGDCSGDETWWRCPILKITPKTVVIAGFHEGSLTLNRAELEAAGEVWHKGARGWYLTEAKKAESSYTYAPVSDVPYDPEKFGTPPEPELTEDQKEWAEELCRAYFAKNPDGTVKDCLCRLNLDHDLSVPRPFVERLGLAKKRNQPVAVDTERRAALEAFVAAIQAGHPESHICYDDGPKWWRIIEEEKDGRRHVYGFVRREDGAIFRADGWTGPARDTGILGFLDNYDPDLLGKYSVRTEVGRKWRRLNNIAKH